jgi:hypothetical protein
MGRKSVNYHFDVERLRNEIRSLVRKNPELEQDAILMADMIEGETSFERVIDGLLAAKGDAQTYMAALTDYMESLSRRLDRYETSNNAIRSIIFFLMQETGIKKLERPLGTLSVANGRPNLRIIDEGLIPEPYFRIKKEPNKTAIAEALKAGDNVPGVEWSNAAPHLTIRT